MSVTYLNQGMYDVVEAARLVEVPPAQVTRWATETSRRPALVTPSLDGLFSFHDLISLRIIAQLVRRRLSLDVIASGIRQLSKDLGTDVPLAHESLKDDKLATVGRSFFANMDGTEWVDVGKGRQGAFQALVLPALKGIEYGPDGLAAIWRPVERVWLNPRVQAGASCIDQTRMPTAVVFELLSRGEEAVHVAADYDLDLDDVTAAWSFENELRKAA